MNVKLVTSVSVFILIFIGSFYDADAQRGGDKLISYPVLLKKPNPDDQYFLSFFLQRALKQDSWNRDYKDNQLTGPEPRVIFDGNPDSVVSEPDELIVDFAFADEDSIFKLVNIKEDDWNMLPDTAGKFRIKGEPALIVYGSGGFRRGYDYISPDSSLSFRKGLYADIYDTGFDQTMKHFMVPLPPNIFKPFIPVYPQRNFYCRVRFRVNAKNNGTQFKTRPDDKDDFIIDNIKLEKYDHVEYNDSHLIVKNIKLEIPYSVIPVNQSMDLPVSLEVQNNSPLSLPKFQISLLSKISGDKYSWPEKSEDPWKQEGYYFTEDVFKLKPYESRRIHFRSLSIPFFLTRDSFEISKIKAIEFKAIAKVNPYGNGIEQYAVAPLFIRNYYNYDIIYNQHNNVGEYLYPGRGLVIQAESSGDYTINSVGGVDNKSGRIAVKFNLRTDDILSGYQSLFGYYATGPDDIIFRMHHNSSSDMPGEIVEGTELITRRTYDEIREEYITDEYCTAFLKKPITLEPGEYWLSISQLGETGLQLGASDYQMAMATTNYSEKEPYGSKGTCLFIDEKFRQKDSQGNMGNMNIFAYNNSLNNDTAWVSFSPNVGNPAYAHHDHAGRGAKNVTEAPYDSIATYARGTWIPMIRPYFGPSKWVSNPEIPDEETVVGIYPNPADRYIIISSNQSIVGCQYAEIVDLMGNVVDSFSYESSAGLITRDVSKLVNGLYFYRLKISEKLYQGSFIISR